MTPPLVNAFLNEIFKKNKITSTLENKGSNVNTIQFFFIMKQYDIVKEKFVEASPMRPHHYCAPFHSIQLSLLDSSIPSPPLSSPIFIQIHSY